MGSTVSRLTFLPPPRQLGELSSLRQDPNLVLFPTRANTGDAESSRMVAALKFDRGTSLTVLYSHGNAEDLLDIRSILLHLSEALDVNVIGYDYHGYGLTGGLCSEASCSVAADACLHYLLREGADVSSIVLMGRSLGTGPTIELASREPVIAGVVLQSPLLSILQTRFSTAMIRQMTNVDMFDNARRVPSIECPVFILHGVQDRIVPWEHGERLQNLVKNSVRPWWVDGYGHNDLHQHSEYYGRLAEFIEFVQARQRRRWEETAMAFKTVVLQRPATKLLLNAL